MRKFYVMSVISLIISSVALALVLLHWLQGTMRTFESAWESSSMEKTVRSSMERAMKSALEKTTITKPFASRHQYSHLSDSAMRQTITIMRFETKVVSAAELSDISDSYRRGLLSTGLFDVVDKESTLNVDKITAGEVTIAYGKTYTIIANMKDVKTGEIVALGQVFINDKKEFAEKAEQLAVLLTNQLKIKRILKEFEGVKTYTCDNALVKQIVEMGDDAIQPLLDLLDDTSSRQWAKKMAIEDALNNLLTENHKETILKVFKEKDCCSKLIKKYKFPEAEDVVMDKLKYNRRVDHDVIDIALMLNRERSIPLLINYVSYSTDPVHAARALATIPDIDVTEPLRKAARNVRGVWAQSGIAKLLIERGTKEGLDIAILVLRNTEEHSEYRKREISYTLGAYTDAKGNYNEMANWLEKNKDSLVWNEEYRRFK